MVRISPWATTGGWAVGTGLMTGAGVAAGASAGAVCPAGIRTVFGFAVLHPTRKAVKRSGDTERQVKIYSKTLDSEAAMARLGYAKDANQVNELKCLQVIGSMVLMGY